jgi:hypothetical protein
VAAAAADSLGHLDTLLEENQRRFGSLIHKDGVRAMWRRIEYEILATHDHGLHRSSLSGID